MNYVNFTFENFKGVHQMSIDLDGGVTTLIGLNESGKTTILEAIFCFAYGAENLDAIDPSMASLREPESWIPISKRGNFNESIKITATVRLDDDDKKALKHHLTRHHGFRSTAEVPSTVRITESHQFENSRFADLKLSWDLRLEGLTGQQRKPRLHAGNDSAVWLSAVAFLKPNLPRIWYFPNFLFELPERFSLEDKSEILTEDEDKNRFYRETFEQILSGLGTDANLETHVVERAKSQEVQDRRSLEAVLLDMARDITATLLQGWNRIFGRDPAAQEVHLQVDTDVETGDAYLELRIKGVDGYYDLSERSLGFRWFFMFLLMTSYRGLSDTNANVVLLLDEPASNLHSHAQAELLKSFETLAETCHLVYTTHSHHLINIRWLDGALVVVNEALGDSVEDYLNVHTARATEITVSPYRRFVAEFPNRTSFVQPILDLLDYAPSALELGEPAILVEGKTDFYALKYFSEILELESPRLVPGMGSGSLDPLISLHAGWGQAFSVLLDSDKEGIAQRARYEEKFGPLLDGRCLLISEVCGDAQVAELEDLLDASDRELMVTAALGSSEDGRTEKKAFGRAITELFATRKEVAISAPSVDRIAALLEKLSSELAAQTITGCR